MGGRGRVGAENYSVVADKYSAGADILTDTAYSVQVGVVQRLSTNGMAVSITGFRLTSKLLAIFLYRQATQGGPVQLYP